MRYKKNVGDLGEDFAASLLEYSGFRIIERNFRTKSGEIDIIAVREGVIHFIEVKTRTGNGCGWPSESVTQTKQERIRRAAKQYLNMRRMKWQSVSIDVFEVMTDFIEDCI